MSIKIPVLLIAFNRFSYTQKVIESLRDYEPTKLYLAMDAPKNKFDEESQNKIIRFVRENLKESDVIEIRGKVNLGTGKFIPDAISKFFEFENFGVILEDDCVPSQSFFDYCLQMKDIRKLNPRVMAVCGTNLLSEGECGDSYFFGPFFVPWGWATWKSEWKKFDQRTVSPMEIKSINFSSWYKSRKLGNFMRDYIVISTGRNSEVWTGFWLYSIIRSGGVIAIPVTNLVTNIGFQGVGNNSNRTLQKLFTRMSFELNAPDFQELKILDIGQLEKLYYQLLKSANRGNSSMMARYLTITSRRVINFKLIIVKKVLGNRNRPI